MGSIWRQRRGNPCICFGYFPRIRMHATLIGKTNISDQQVNLFDSQ
jgi:hypothetical protein